MPHHLQGFRTAGTPGDFLRLIIVLVGCLALNTPAKAQIDWFAGSQMSYVSARAYASVAAETEDRCVFAALREPEFCPWCRQFDRCRRLQLSLGSGTTAHDRVRTAARSVPALDATSRSAFGQGVDFQPDGFRMDLRVATEYGNQGTNGPGNRGIGTAAGEVYLRVPGSTTIDYAFDGLMRWSAPTAAGRIQLVGVPNTGADLSAGFAFHAHQLPGGSPATLRHRGSLKPGLYRLIWSIEVDSIGRQAPQGFDLLGEFKVEKRTWEQCMPGGVLADRASFPPKSPVRMTPLPPQVSSSQSGQSPAPEGARQGASLPSAGPQPVTPARQSAIRSSPESALVDVDLLDGAGGGDFGSMRRQRFHEWGLPMNGCVVLAHGDPDVVWDTRGSTSRTLTATELAREILASSCPPDVPVVLLACNTGRPRTDGGLNFAERLTRALRSAGRRNTEVWAPNAYVEAGGVIPDVGLQPYIVLDNSNYLDWLRHGYLSPPQAERDVAPWFIRYVDR